MTSCSARVAILLADSCRTSSLPHVHPNHPDIRYEISTYLDRILFFPAAPAFLGGAASASPNGGSPVVDVGLEGGVENPARAGVPANERAGPLTGAAPNAGGAADAGREDGGKDGIGDGAVDDAAGLGVAAARGGGGAALGASVCPPGYKMV